MGLDQYAFSTSKQLNVTHDVHGFPACEVVQATNSYVWRKHSKLQTFMEGVFGERGGLLREQDYAKYADKNSLTSSFGPPWLSFNCNPILLELEDIANLEACLMNGGLPESEGGLFFGHQFQDEQADRYREQDIEFCAWARKEFDRGRHVYYDCWW